tara:strand:- start:13 stop:1164 length:1152 start_codon:yes stop_codon:yes gene_type:complete
MSVETLFEQKVTAQDQRAGTSIEVGQEESDSVESAEESQLDMFGDIFDGDLVDDDAESDEPQDALPDDDEQTPIPEGELDEDRAEVLEQVAEPQAEPQAKPEPRNYEEFDEAERPLLKQMSNAAFEKYSKNRNEMVEAKQQLEELRSKSSDTKLPENFHEHPEAYTLSPEYREAAGNYTKAQTEYAHWKEQLINVRNGEPWQGIDGYDADGKLVAGKQPFKATQSSEIDIESALQEAKNFMNQFGQQATHIQDNYSKIYSQADDMLSSEQKKHFEWEENAEKLQTSVDTPNGKPATIGDLKKGFFDAMPGNFQKHPVTNLASNLYVTVQLYAAELGKLKKQLDVSATNRKDSRRVEPRSSRKAESVSSDDDVFLTDDFEKLLG